MVERKKFKDWYEARYHFPYPGHPGEMTATMLTRLTDAMAEWCDMLAEETRGPQSAEPFWVDETPSLKPL